MNSGEESALPLVSSSSSASNKYEGTASLDSSWKMISVEVVRELGLITCERVFLAKGPDSSFGGVPVGNCLDDDHKEEEVQVRVQIEVEGEEQGIGETHGKEQGEEQREQIKRTTWMTIEQIKRTTWMTMSME